MNNQPCANCPRLQAEVNRLEIEVQKLHRETLRLKRVINGAASLCALVSAEADTVLAAHSSKGVWAYNKGKKEAAERIGQALHH